MMAKMQLSSDGARVDLLIERDAGNPIMILMGGKDKATIRQNWQALQALTNEALEEIENLNLPERKK